MPAAPLDRMMSRAIVMIGVVLLGTACRRTADAQLIDDSLGPIRCFEIVDAMNLASQSALDLCTGATSDAPGRCYAELFDRFPLTTQRMVALCRGATSLEPVACYEELAASETLTEQQIIGYCATTCPLGPAPPQASDPACLGAALERTNLALQTAGELCLSSRSAGPVDCYLRGVDVTTLADLQLIQLCAHTSSCQYLNAPPPE